MRAIRFSVGDTDAVHVYSDAKHIWLQLRRDVPTERDIDSPSFKTAFRLTQTQALAIAGELLTAASHQQNEPPSVKPAATPKLSQQIVVQQLPAKIDTPANHGKPWTPDEDKRLAEAFDAQVPILEIAELHQRGIGGIQSRLIKLGKVAIYQQVPTEAASPSP